MKNLIIAMLLSVACLLSGCNEDEVIELYEIKADVEEETTSESDVLTDGNNGNISSDLATDNDTQMAGNSEDSRPFVVFVTGQVVKPGVYEIQEGSRVIDAIVAAGGYTEDADGNYVNLASKVSDEEMIYIPSKAEIEEGNVPTLKENTQNSDGNQSTSGIVNINKASKEELMTLPGIGESKAEKIITFREQNGGFNSTEDIMQISGIKEGMYNKIKDRISVR